jgi:HAD superfamily hydrolase (TIGR01509 family)
MAVLRTPTAVLLDLDGTLVHTVPTRIDAWTAALADFGIPSDRDFVASMIGSDGRQLARDAGERVGIPMRRDRAAEIDIRHGEIYEALNIAPAVLPGVHDLVDALRAASIPWAIATSSSTSNQVQASVAALRLAEPPVVVDGSHVDHAKPAPDLFLLAAEQLGVVDVSGCWCVGDATWDVLAAKAAGMIAIGVTAGSATDEVTLRRTGAALVVSSLADLVPLVGPS